MRVRLDFLTSVLAATRDKLRASEARNAETEGRHQVRMHGGWGEGAAGRQGGMRGQRAGRQGCS